MGVKFVVPGTEMNSTNWALFRRFEEENMRTITKVLVTAILPAILLVCMLPQQARPQSRANFWFLNNTGKTLNNLYVSPHSANSWGTDVLGRAALPDGMGTLIVFPPAWRGVCHEDFKLVFSDGTAEQYQQGIDVCQLHALQFDAATVSGF
jgi:hypothetical protein